VPLNVENKTSFISFGQGFLEIDQSETRIACGGHVLMDRDEMSNLYRGSPIDASYQVSVHLAKRFQRRRFFRNQTIRNKNCLWWPCLLTDRDKMSNRYRGPSIDAAYQVSVHLAEGFQRRKLKCEKLTDNRRRMPSDGKSSHCIWQGELKKFVYSLFQNIANLNTANLILHKKISTNTVLHYIILVFCLLSE
jgi:hypothetical protein